LSTWRDYRVEVDEYRELDGERVLVLNRFSGCDKTSGMEIGQMLTRPANVFYIRDGKVTRLVLQLGPRGGPRRPRPRSGGRLSALVVASGPARALEARDAQLGKTDRNRVIRQALTAVACLDTERPMSLESQHAWVFEINRGKISKIRAFISHAEALEAVGLAG
jgi:hypothetical protein